MVERSRRPLWLTLRCCCPNPFDLSRRFSTICWLTWDIIKFSRLEDQTRKRRQELRIIIRVGSPASAHGSTWIDGVTHLNSQENNAGLEKWLSTFKERTNYTRAHVSGDDSTCIYNLRLFRRSQQFVIVENLRLDWLRSIVSQSSCPSLLLSCWLKANPHRILYKILKKKPFGYTFTPIFADFRRWVRIQTSAIRNNMTSFKNFVCLTFYFPQIRSIGCSYTES